MGKHFFYLIIPVLFSILPANRLLAQNIGERTFLFTDKARNRPVTTEVWYPTSDTLTAKDRYQSPFFRTYTVRDGKPVAGKHGLVFISHGAGGGRLTLEWLADKLVSAGYIVASVDHYGNTFTYSTPQGFLEPWERPQDISFSLTELLKDSVLSPLIDRKRLGMAGFSIGGYTTLALAGARLNFSALKAYCKSATGQKEINLPEFPGLLKFIDDKEIAESFRKSPVLTDRRFNAFLAICPAIGQGFQDGSQVKDIRNPVFIIAAEADSIAPSRTNASHYHRMIKTSKFYLFKGKVGHYVFLNEVRDFTSIGKSVFFTDDPSVSRHDVHEQTAKMTIDFFNANIGKRSH